MNVNTGGTAVTTDRYKFLWVEIHPPSPQHILSKSFKCPSVNNLAKNCFRHFVQRSYDDLARHLKYMLELDLQFGVPALHINHIHLCTVRLVHWEYNCTLFNETLPWISRISALVMCSQNGIYYQLQLTLIIHMLKRDSSQCEIWTHAINNIFENRASSGVFHIKMELRWNGLK